ncbi:hypothetical protein ASPZODRAFT_351084 [Penicilliopsis zonata CBS 506.65]|uniref:Uncharacterized protein n=1 Tax=Penicilliopsis zonata CBS 506.65 TaxID=1073090 RepID=A0A1L9SVQ0_9EURO|nr:hypothetical protein ASPZODRAFT_351084 [Penicilliopsis zonata CBS 506.65]OJJ51282.1 hypothetical protein ASPZODRAFT_351084 [Penicilliopsis zonata CBS 506.65]
MGRDNQLKLFLEGAKPDQRVALHSSKADLEVIFDFWTHLMIIREQIPVPGGGRTKHSESMVSVHFDTRLTRFKNLRGLEDGSLLFSFEMPGKAHPRFGNGLHVKHKCLGFDAETPKSRLYTRLAKCGWANKQFQLYIPVQRTRGWKTVALILLTFDVISYKDWEKLIMADQPIPVPGLDWAEIEQQLAMEKEVNGEEEEEEEEQEEEEEMQEEDREKDRKEENKKEEEMKLKMKMKELFKSIY